MNIEMIALGCAGFFALLYVIAMVLLIRSTPGHMVHPPQKQSQGESAGGNKSFAEVVGPVMEWLETNKHPHTSVIIDASHAEMVEGIECVRAKRMDDEL